MYFDSCWPNPLYCQHEHEMRHNMCWPNKSHASDDTKCIWTRLTQPLKCQRGHKILLTMCFPNPSLAWKDTKCPSTCDDETRNKPARTQIKSLFEVTKIMPTRTHVLTKQIPCQWWHKMYRTCFDTTPKMPARTQNPSYHVLSKPIPRLRRHKMCLYMCWRGYLHLFWPNTSHSSNETKYTSNPVHASEDTICI